MHKLNNSGAEVGLLIGLAILHYWTEVNSSMLPFSLILDGIVFVNFLVANPVLLTKYPEL